MRRIVTAILLIMLIFSGCKVSNATFDKDKEIASFSPSDFNFSLSFGVGGKNEVDTFSNTYTKDLVANGVKTVEFKLTDAEKKMVFLELAQIGIFSYAEEFKENGYRTPLAEYTLEVKYKSWHKKIEWNANSLPPTESIVDKNNQLTEYKYVKEKKTEEIRILQETIEKIIKMIQQKEEYRKLPETTSGYA